MTKNISPDYPRDPESLQTLNDILRPSYEGVDSLGYRAQHEKLLDLINHLEIDELIRRKNDRYRLSLVGLAVLNNDYVQGLLVNFEKLFDFLKRFYKENQRDFITINDLVKHAKLHLDQVKESLSYMREGSVLSSYPEDFYSAEDTKVKPAETILRYSSFQDVINELQHWANVRIAGRIKQAGSLSSDISIMQQLGVSRQKLFPGPVNYVLPDWIEKLKPEFQRIMNEIYIAAGENLVALPTMGLRAVIDMVCNDLVGDKGSFASKLEALFDQGYISASQKEILSSALEVGHASAHRGHFPHVEDLKDLIAIVEHLLQGIYIHRPAAEKLKETAPKRSNK